MVPVLVGIASSSGFGADAVAKFIIPERAGSAFIGEASALAVVLVPVEALCTNRWSTSAHAFLVVENFVRSANLWSADACLLGGIVELHHIAVVWLVDASSGLNVEVFTLRAVEWANFALAIFGVKEGRKVSTIIINSRTINACSLNAKALARISVPECSGEISTAEVLVSAGLWDAVALASSIFVDIPVVAGHALIWVLFALARLSVEELSVGTKR